jgi:hypothetical protein
MGIARMEITLYSNLFSKNVGYGAALDVSNSLHIAEVRAGSEALRTWLTSTSADGPEEFGEESREN